MHFWNQEERLANKERFHTAPFDPRFPSTNQRKRCWINYVDFWKCAATKGEDSPVCESFKLAYTELCPPPWTEEWNDQRESGRFPVREICAVEPQY